MTTATLGRLKINKIKANSVNFPEINWKLVCLISLAVCLPLLVFYVYQISNLTRGSYLINSYESQIKKLTEENKNLQISFAENSFLGEALIKIQALNFQKVTSVKYMQISEGSIAKAK